MSYALRSSASICLSFMSISQRNYGNSLVCCTPEIFWSEDWAVMFRCVPGHFDIMSDAFFHERLITVLVRHSIFYHLTYNTKYLWQIFLIFDFHSVSSVIMINKMMMSDVSRYTRHTRKKRSKTVIHVTIWDCQDKWPYFSWKQTTTTRALWRDRVWYIADRYHYHQYTDHRLFHHLCYDWKKKRNCEIISSFLTTIIRLLFFYHMFLSKPESAFFLLITVILSSRALCLFISLWRHLRIILHIWPVPRMSLMSDQVTRADVRMHIEYVFT